MKRPYQLAGVNVPRANVTCRPLRRVLLRSAAGDDQVLVHRGRRTHSVVARKTLENLWRIQVDDAVIAEGIVWLTGLRMKRDQPAVMSTKDDLGGRLRIARPVLRAARRRHA